MLNSTLGRFQCTVKNAILILLLLSPPLLHAQVIHTGTKPNASVNYHRLLRIDSLMNDYIHNNWITGAVTLVVKDNELVQYKGYGYADAETKKPMRQDAIFRIASQTKAITSTGILILYEEGRLLLDQPIADFIPEFKNPVVLNTYNAADTTYTTIPARRSITIRDLLTHSSGLDYPGIGSEKMRAIYAKAAIPSGLGDINANLLDKMKALARLPLSHQPGEKFTYGLSVDLLGCLIEVISGKNLNDFFMERIFRPLGMKDTYFNMPADKASRLVAVYTEDSLHQIAKWKKGSTGIDPDYPLLNKHYFSGGAGLSSTAYDYALFLQMILNGGTYNGKEILSPRTVDMMLHNQLNFSFNGTNNFGLGFEIVTDKGAAMGARNIGSFSWGGFFGTTYWADPKAHLICLIMTQQTPNSHGDLAKKFENLVYASLK